MANSADPDQLASSEFVCKDRVYLGSAGQGLIENLYKIMKVMLSHKPAKVYNARGQWYSISRQF